MSDLLPSLSQIQTTTVDHLTGLAADFTAEADLIERCFTDAHELMGTVCWQGQAFDAAYARTDSDRATAVGLAEQRRDAAKIAQLGAENMLLARAAALSVVEEGHAAGFEVSEGLSMSAYTPGRPLEQAMRLQAAATALTAELRAQAASMVAIDKDTTTKLAAATAGFGSLRFTEAPLYTRGSPTTNRHNGVQLVDHTWKQGPDQPNAPAGPSAADIQGVTKDLPRGTSPDIKLVQTQQQLENLYKWASQHGTQIPDPYGPQPGTAYMLPDGTRIGMRAAADSTKLPALDIKYPGPNGAYEKVHINAAEGAAPQIPSVRAPVEAAPPAAGEPAPPPAAPRAEPAPVEPPPVRPAPVEPPPPVAPPRVSGGGSGIGGGGGAGIPGLGIGGIHTPVGEVE
ncbi:hypothetical protein [Mycobacterium kyorinense]|uniref:Uncharacterized protein n=1 Tax=Mycobacterium kyorinense TaxID=487514 RepID=A0A1X1Y5I4_9MYCO|nr:hypothetical protein [Mycobacterium kyorinense]ORW06357.1 hypothetical protein AWC14_25755 [Mycobacterium kyorinense]